MEEEAEPEVDKEIIGEAPAIAGGFPCHWSTR